MWCGFHGVESTSAGGLVVQESPEFGPMAEKKRQPKSSAPEAAPAASSHSHDHEHGHSHGHAHSHAHGACHGHGHEAGDSHEDLDHFSLSAAN